jgi:hypothetical protein
MICTDDLYQMLSSIGISVVTNKKIEKFTDIEATLSAAIEQIPCDLRLLSLILSWVNLHGDKVNIERIDKMVKNSRPPWLSLVARFAVSKKYYRWKKLIVISNEILSNGDLLSNQKRAELKGEEEWSRDSGFIIPQGSEPTETKYILAPNQLAKINQHYFNKLLYGPNWRSDIATAIESGAKNPYQAAKLCGCSYEPAHRIFADFLAAGKIAAA